jgi:lysyl-tRNA synthetase class 2
MTPKATAKDTILRRGRALASLRGQLAEQGFIEVTTPVLLAVRSDGPTPRHPFKIGAREFDLRHSIELLLRTALAAAPRIYDIGPAVRFEDAGKAPRSAVEFTLMELYATDLDYSQLMKLAEDLIRATAMSPLPPCTKINVAEWFETELKVNFGRHDETEISERIAKFLGPSSVHAPLWALINSCIERFLEPQLTGFCFLYDYPMQTVCLARRSPNAPSVIERFETFIDGVEVGHGFVDASDPLDVLARMKQSGPEFVDMPFIARLEAGELPPSSGFGIGIERLLAATDEKNKDVCAFLHEYQHGVIATEGCTRSAS